MATATPKLGLLKPTDGADFDIWGPMLNGNFDILDNASPITYGDVPPPAPAIGLLWFDSVALQLYVRYNDGNSTQWVPATNVAALGNMAFLPLSGGTLSGGIGVFNAAPPPFRPVVTGAKGGNAALASLLTALASYGFVTDSST